MPEYICTMGPSISSLEKIIELYHLGLKTIRFNMSHIDYNINEILKIIQQAEKEVNGKIFTLLDTRGSEIRIKVPFTRQIHKGEILTLGIDFFINIPYNGLILSDDIIQIDDGKIKFKVLASNGDLISVIALTDGKLKNEAGMYLERLASTLPFLSKEDVKHFHFAFSNNLDWVACSFVRTEDDIQSVLEIKRMYPNCQTKIMAKIETKEAVLNLDKIIQISDGIMIARGDLGVSFPLHLIATLEEYIAQKAISKETVLTIGTGFLRSMKQRSFPERAEVTDLYQAFHFTNKIMFSGETAIADDPSSILRTANLIYDSLTNESIHELKVKKYEMENN